MVQSLEKTKIHHFRVHYSVSARDDRDFERKRVDERKNSAGSPGAVHKSGFGIGV